MEPVYSFTLALFLTIAIIPLLIRYSEKLGLVDVPNDRKVHDRLVPRSGGVAIVLGVLIPLSVLFSINKEMGPVVLASLVIALFGFLDDRNDLSYRWKFLGQIVAVVTVIGGGVLVERVPLLGLDPAPVWISYPLTFFLVLGVTNAVNLSDGLDGLAGGTTLLALIAICLFSVESSASSSTVLAATVIGAILGFLRYNTFPARIFMGDTGSQFLGFVAVCLAIVVSQPPYSAISPAIPLLVFGIPILDTLMVMAIRMKAGRSPFSPDKNHLHHQLIAFGFYHYEAVAIIYVLQIGLLLLTYLLRYQSDGLILSAYVAIAGIFTMSLYVGKRSHWRVRPVDRQRSSRERRNQLLRKQEWLYHHSGLLIECMAAMVLLYSGWLVNAYTPGLGGASLSLGVVLFIASICLWKYPAIAARINCYIASVWLMYGLSLNATGTTELAYLHGFMLVLVLALAVAIRTTRRQQFRLDTQDLLVLALVIVTPLLPFDALERLSVGEITLRLAVLMYSCEFIIAKRGVRTLWVLNTTVLLSLLLAGLHL